MPTISPSRSWGQHILDFLTGGELFFLLFLTSGQFKTLLSPIQNVIDLTLVFMGLSGLCALWRFYKSGFSLPIKGMLRVFVPYIIILLCYAVSLTYTLSLSYSKTKFIDYAIKLGFTVLMPFFLLNNRKSVMRFLVGLVLYSGILIGQTVVLSITDNFGGIHFINVLATSYMHAARWIVGGFTIAYAFLLFKEGMRHRWLLFVYCILALFSILVGGARATFPLFYIVVALLLVLLLPLHHRRMLHAGSWIKRYGVSVALFALCSVIIWNTPFANTLRYRMGVVPKQYKDAQFGQPGEFDLSATDDENAPMTPIAPTDYGSDKRAKEMQRQYEKNEITIPEGHPGPYLLPSEWRDARIAIPIRYQLFYWERMRSSKTLINRFEHIQFAWLMIQGHPIRGWGIGMYPVYVLNLDIQFYPHNMFFEIWAEGGLLAFLSFVLMIFLSLKNALLAFWRNRKGAHCAFFAAILLCLCYWLSMTMLVDFVNGGRILFTFMAIAAMAPFDELQTPRQVLEGARALPQTTKDKLSSITKRISNLIRRVHEIRTHR